MIGIDIIEIPRIEAAYRRYDNKFLQRIFTPEEIAACRQKPNMIPSLAARFCAKEAAIKALGKAFPWKNFEILNDSYGKPELRLSGEALLYAGAAHDIDLSMSHCRSHAAAVVFLKVKR